MKKRFAIIILMLVAAVGLYAQDLKGTWKTQVIKDSLDMDYVFTFTDYSLNMKFYVSHENPELGKIVMSILLPSTYTRDGDTIKIDYMTELFKINVETMEFTDEAKKAMDEEPGMSDLVKGLMEVAINSNKDKLIEQFKQSDELKIHHLDAASLVLIDETGEAMLFTRFDEK